MVTAEDLCAGLNKIGLRASLEEAMAIQASVSNGQNLNFDQFRELIFAKDNKFNVDLAQITAPSQEDKMRAFERMATQG